MTFENFWAAYPIHKGKIAAQRAWTKLKPDSELSTIIMRAIQEQKREKYLLAAANQFVPAWPHGSSWINGRRWEDEISAAPERKFTAADSSETILRACREKGIATLGESRARLLAKLNSGSQ